MSMHTNFLTPDEKLLFAKVLNQVSFCQKKHEQTFTDFLDPVRAEQFLQMIRRESDVNSVTFGGHAHAERSIIGFFPDYTEPSESLFPIEILEISYNKKFSRELEHRDYLGSILGLGIERSKVGDILLLESSAIAFVKTDMASYLLTNLEKVSHTKVSVSLKENIEVSSFEKEERQGNFIVSSLRLDAVVSAVFRLSRAKSADLIKAEKVFVNWKPIANASKIISVGDTITLRGRGRAKILDIVSKTKKERLVLNVSF